MQIAKLTFEKEEDFRVKEAFRTLRSNVEFCGEDVRSVAVTSCTPNEGKTSCAMDLARAFAESGRYTILVDGDMRKSVLVGRYKAGSLHRGLTHYLAAREQLDDVICETNVPNLHIIFSGPVPPNPSELLGTPRFTKMMEDLRKTYDYVIIDTPPLGSVIDAAVVSKQCDGTILVIESNAVSYRFAQRVKGQLDVAGARILGVVLNKVDMTGRRYYGHYGNYYGRYYGKYYGNYAKESSSYQNQLKAEASEHPTVNSTPVPGNRKKEVEPQPVNSTPVPDSRQIEVRQQPVNSTPVPDNSQMGVKQQPVNSTTVPDSRQMEIKQQPVNSTPVPDNRQTEVKQQPVNSTPVPDNRQMGVKQQPVNSTPVPGNRQMEVKQQPTPSPPPPAHADDKTRERAPGNEKKPVADLSVDSRTYAERLRKRQKEKLVQNLQEVMIDLDDPVLEKIIPSRENRNAQ